MKGKKKLYVVLNVIVGRENVVRVVARRGKTDRLGMLGWMNMDVNTSV